MRKVISVFGSSAPLPGEPAYEQAFEGHQVSVFTDSVLDGAPRARLARC